MLEKDFFQQKKNKLKGSNVTVMKSLTPKRMDILKKARLEHGFANVWTSDGRILYRSPTEYKVKLYYE